MLPRGKRNILIGLATVTTGILLTAMSIAVHSVVPVAAIANENPSMSSSSEKTATTAANTQTLNNDPNTNNTSSTSVQSHHYQVNAGGGGPNGPITQFAPKVLHIRTGDKVTWANPTTVGEPHTVSFIKDNKTIADIFSPFAVKNSTDFTAIPPNANSKPMIMPGPNGTEIVVGANQRALIGNVIAANGTVIPIGPNANYTMKGDEKFVNSGTIMPKGMENQLPGSGNAFTVTFDKAGTYHYMCLFHDWMNGTIVVQASR